MWLDTLIESVIKAVAKFSRKSGPEPDRGFDRAHAYNLYDFCVYCGEPKKTARAGAKCPGPK